MYARMYVCMCCCVHVCKEAVLEEVRTRYVCTYAGVCMCACAIVYMYVHTCVCMYACAIMYMYAKMLFLKYELLYIKNQSYMRACMHACTDGHTYIHTYIHTYTGRITGRDAWAISRQA